MKILILYDSFFGNTKKIAEIIHDELNKNNEIDFGKVGFKGCSYPKSYDLIIIGSPTRGFTCTKDILNFVKSLPVDSSDISFAIFDTNLDVKKINNRFLSFLVKRFGYSNDTIHKILNKKKGNIIGMEKFYVADNEGPLENGEEKRAIEFSHYSLEEIGSK